MRSSSPSNSHCSLPSIKAQHRQAKKRKTIRRKRIDLTCGCSYYLNINCRNDGFTHRGIHHCSSTTEWRVYLGAKESPIFQNPGTSRGVSVRSEPTQNQDPHNVQPRVEESVGDTQGILGLCDLPSIDSAIWADLECIQELPF
uniref:Transcriptional activator protein n=1 Tax=Dolichos yellow mosaic virus TaxID=333968 RepID=A0A3G2WMA7_9GEMI|nr:AC2 [Dolichos yellow mosaic virus]WOK21461.1 AC2 [Dolichos yellow mosaic virus]